ncbi:MFS transporter [Thermoactinospora rubra]|uniref:MFS transporter n=1 Tax=Thermoactinospora rubra TaxID=1088767 RepID=UPI00117EF907|nr:MFS transporter [Thermoactinospora rubra]
MLVVAERTRSYGVAGLVLTCHALALAVCAPLTGRLADRRRARPVLVAFLAAHALAYGTLLAALALAVPAAALIASAVLLGATTPPATSVGRAAWPRLVPAESLPAAYALDNAVNELMFVAGPVLVSVLLLAAPAQAIVAGAGAALLLGVALLAASPAVRDHTPAGRPTGSRGRLARLSGPLAHRPTLVVLAVAATAAFAFGCLRVATLAAATVSGAPAAAGVLMGLLSAGALAGGLLYGTRTWPFSGRTMLIALSLADAAILLADAAPTGLAALAALVALTGLLQGPRDALQATLLAGHTPAEHRTEAFSWLNTFMWTGYGLGAAIAGRLTGPLDGGAPAFLAAAAVALLGAALAAACYRPASAEPG